MKITQYETYQESLTRLAVIQKDIGRLRIECLKRSYQNTEDLVIAIQNLQDEEAIIINSFDLTELALYYQDYRDALTEEMLRALGIALLELQVRKNNERKGRV